MDTPFADVWKDTMKQEEKAIAYLSKDPLLHVDMLECIRRGSAELLDISDTGVLLCNTACGAVMMSAEKEDTADRMLAALDAAPLFVAHQEFYLPKVRQKFDFQEKRVCRQAVYPGKKRLPNPPGSVTIRRLEERHLPFVVANYSHADDETYLRERILCGALFGAFADGRLTGFIGIHGEGSMGMLEVLPEYRRRGIASALGAFLINRTLEEGRVPFSQIIVDNGPSMSLHRKFGFAFSSGTVCWLIQTKL